MATGSIIIIWVPVSIAGDWALAPSPPNVSGAYIPVPPVVGTKIVSVTINCTLVALFDSLGNLMGQFTSGDFPSGFKVTSIGQVEAGDPVTGGMPGPAMERGHFGTYIDWDTGILGLSMGGTRVYDPATMSFNFASGLWVFNGSIEVSFESNPSGAIIYSQYDLTSIGIENPFVPPIPIGYYSGVWEDGECPLIESVNNAQIVNPATGEFSWELPALAEGVALTIRQAGETDVVVLVMSPALSYTPINIFGTVDVLIRPITTYPICYGAPVFLNLNIDIPPSIDIMMSGGISLGGEVGLAIIGDPSGIYTLVSGQTHDTLYERITGITSQDVKIPKPFIKTAFHGS